MSNPRITTPMNLDDHDDHARRTTITMRPDANTTKRHVDLAPIWVRLRPAQSTMEDWGKVVDQYLREKAELDRQCQAKPQTSAAERRDL